MEELIQESSSVIYYKIKRTGWNMGKNIEMLPKNATKENVLKHLQMMQSQMYFTLPSPTWTRVEITM